MYLANRSVSQNGGQANTSIALTTRHQPAATVTGNYHQSANYFGNMVSNHAHNAVQGALLDARDQIAREEAARGGLARGDSRGHATGGRGATGEGAPTGLDLSMINEETCRGVAREISESIHGDSEYTRLFSEIARKAGPPSTFTNLPLNGQIFNSRSIPSSSNNHRVSNNRLGAGPTREEEERRSNLLYPTGVNLPTTTESTTSQPTTTQQTPRSLFQQPDRVQSTAAQQSNQMLATTTHRNKAASLAAIEQQQIEQATRESLEYETIYNAAHSHDNTKKRAANTSQSSQNSHVVSTTKKQSQPKKKNQQPPSLLQRVNNTINTHEVAAPTISAEMPACLDDVNADTSFFTAPAGRQHPSRTPIASTQKNPMKAVMHGDDDDVEIVQNDEDKTTFALYNRALARSFDETNVGGPVINVDTGEEEDSQATIDATSRVHYMLDKPEKALQLTSMFQAKMKRENKVADSPAVNAMIDKFMKSEN